MKSHTSKKPREVHIASNVETCESITTVNGQLVITGGQRKASNGTLEPATHTITLGYRQDNPTNPQRKFKQVAKVFSRAERISADVNRELFAHNLVFAVDTNTKNGISASVMVQLLLRTNENGHVVLFGIIYFSILISKLKSCPEKYGLRKFIESVLNTESNREKKIVFITDHDRDAIPSINSRTIPLIDNFYLPQNITLFYSSVEHTHKNDTISNLAIYSCEKVATKALERVHEKFDLKVQEMPNNEYLFSPPKEFFAGIVKIA